MKSSKRTAKWRPPRDPGLSVAGQQPDKDSSLSCCQSSQGNTQHRNESLQTASSSYGYTPARCTDTDETEDGGALTSVVCGRSQTAPVSVKARVVTGEEPFTEAVLFTLVLQPVLEELVSQIPHSQRGWRHFLGE